ncbi:DUF1127 domain-containing protein [Leisingera sp. ANG-Vp]|uniref:DUF1127 domain-containing protein n=1 Tax=Leisingera sp. ANG-Vp TaxID=1577896 RepID=UPI0005805B56|nr:DUF1127 domain-containing protein [Leisingera sp. ANG-Vp]KIC18789.1 hypothetical protein RA20_13415 [Leisingera sp. ANG-Vp]
MTYLTSSRSAHCAAAKPRLALTARIGLHLAAWRQRRQLAKLDARALEDIGVTRSEAETESRRSFWSAPDHWSC